MKPLGLYLHIPFCRSKCLYCDFCSLPHAAPETVEAYVERMCRDLIDHSADCADYTVDTVYFGGGTPTLLTGEQLEGLLSTVIGHYHLLPDAEISAECNPATADREKLLRMRAAGFNRLSIGLQTAQEAERIALGRLHDFSDFCRTWELARAAGFSNLSADVMFGIPHQTEQSFADTLQKLCALSPEHVSAYALSVEEGTPFGRRGEEKLSLPDEERVRSMYLGMIDQLESFGLRQYEISNFAKLGYESRHNLKYWNTEEYLGFGPAAHSDFGGCRFGNHADIAGYLSGNCGRSESAIPSKEERLNEFVMLQMRLCCGVSLPELEKRYGHAASQRFEERLKVYLPVGLVKPTEQGFAFTPQGMLVSNTVLSEILEF